MNEKPSDAERVSRLMARANYYRDLRKVLPMKVSTATKSYQMELFCYKLIKSILTRQ